MANHPYVVRVYEQIKAAEMDMEFMVAEGRIEASSPYDATDHVSLEDRTEGIDAAFEMQTISDEWARSGNDLDEDAMRWMHIGVQAGIDLGKRVVADPHIFGLILKDMPHKSEMTEDQKVVVGWVADCIRAFAPRSETTTEGGDADVGDDD